MSKLLEQAPRNIVIPNIAMTTDFLGAERDMHQFAPLIAESGFKNTLWCEQWDGDYKYSRAEVKKIDRLFNNLGIQVTQIHAAEGKNYGGWVSPNEKERREGVEGIRNRIKMAADLGASVVTVHAPHHEMPWPGGPRAYQESMKKSLGELQQDAMDAGVKIGLENTDWKGPGKFDNFPAIEYALSIYGPEYVGITYDTGHGNLMQIGQGDHLGRLNLHRDRIVDTHMHDNSGMGATATGKFKVQEGRSQDDDQHRMMFTGTVEWSRLAEIFAKSEGKFPHTSEASMKYDPDMNPKVWLSMEKKNLEIFSGLVEQKKAIMQAVSPNPVGHVLFQKAKA